MRPLRLAVAFAATFAAACGGDDEGGLAPPDAPPAVTADAAPSNDLCTCLALGVDYTNGVGTAARVALPSATITQDAVPGAISGDPVLRAANGGLAVINRFGADNVTWLDPATLAVKAQISAGAGGNPQDAAFDDGRLYAPLFGRAELDAWDLGATPPTPMSPMDLASHDEDGNPNAMSALVLGDWLAVSIGLLDDTDPYLPAKGRGRVLVRPRAGGDFTSLELTYANPVGFLHAAGATTALVPTAPTFSNTDGCVERVQLGETPTADGCLVENLALGGFVTGIAPTADGGAYLAVSDPSYAGKLVRVNPDGSVTAPLTDASVSPTDVAYCEASNQLVYNDAITGGLFVRNLTGGTVVNAEPLDLGLPSAYGNGLACW